MMDQGNNFLKITAIAAILSGITTFLLWLLPKLYTASGFEETSLLYQNGYYLSRLWVNFIHIPLALASYYGLAACKFERNKLLSVFGFAWFSFWGLIEMIGISIIIFAVNFTWRKQYAVADTAQRSVLKSQIQGFYAIWDAMFFVLLISFLVGSICYAAMTWRSRGLEKLLNYLIILSVPLTILIVFGEYVHIEWANAIVNYTYPLLQPVSRILMGLVIWKYSLHQSTSK